MSSQYSFILIQSVENVFIGGSSLKSTVVNS